MTLISPTYILTEWTAGLSQEEKIVTLFEKVRDIPYGSIGSRDPFEVYKCNTGTCSGKHELLKALYHEIGVKTQDYIAMHTFASLPVNFPDHIKELLNRSDIIDPHNFFKIQVGDQWVSVDVTWDLPLKEFGFPVNVGWDGKTDMEICVTPLSIEQTDDPIGFKKRELAKLPETVQQDRLLFLEELTKWVASLRGTILSS